MIKDIKKYQSEGLQPEGKDADRVSIDLRRGNKATPKSLLAGFLCHRLRIYAQTTTDPISTYGVSFSCLLKVTNRVDNLR